MKSSILNFQVEGFFYLWQNMAHFFCHGLKHNQIPFRGQKT